MPKRVTFALGEQERQGLCTSPKLRTSSRPRLDSKHWLEIQKQYRFLMSTLRVAYSSDSQDEDTKIIRIMRSAREICVTEIVSVLQESGLPSPSILEVIQEPPSPLATQSDAAPPHPAKQTDPVLSLPPAKQSDPAPPSPPAKRIPPSRPSKQSNPTPLSPAKQSEPIPPSPTSKQSDPVSPSKQSGPPSLSPGQNNSGPPFPPAAQIETTPLKPSAKQAMATSAHLPDNYPSREVQVYHRLCSGSDNLLRFPLSSDPFELLLPREPLRPATKPRMAHVTLVYPPLEAWPVVASNGAYVTVEDVLFVIHKRGYMLPPNTLFNGLTPVYGGEYFLVLLSDG